MPRPHRLEHEWVGSSKLQHVIRVVLGAAKGPSWLCSHLAGTLQAAAKGAPEIPGVANPHQPISTPM
jgi:hypothetical protein